MTHNNNTINSTTQASALAPVKSDKTFSKSDHFKTSDIELYFQRVIGKKQLEANQTIRLTYDSYRYDADSNGHIMGGVFTYKRQISSVNDLLKFMDHHTDNKNIPDDIKNQIGYSMSASVYESDPAVEEAPGISSMLYTQSFVFDIDSRVGTDRKSDRYAFNNADYESKVAATTHLIGVINTMLAQDNTMDWFLIPSYVYETGGGLQLIFKYTDNLTEKEASLLLGTLKQMLTDTLEKQKYNFKFYMRDILGLRPVYFEIDFSTFDVTHTQRIGGTRNPKKMYAGAVAQELIFDYKSNDGLEKIKSDYKRVFAESAEDIYFDYQAANELKLQGAETEDERKAVGATMDLSHFITNKIDHVNKAIVNANLAATKAAAYYSKIYYSLIPNDTFREYQNNFAAIKQLKDSGRPYDQYTYEYYDHFLQYVVIPVKALLFDCKLAIDKFSSESSVNSKIMDPSNIGTYEMLSKLTPYQQFQIFRSRLKGELPGSKYHKYLCPFHDEHKTPSLGLYHYGAITPKNDCPNNKNLYLYDYHDGKSYDVVSFLMALYELETGQPASKTEILNEIALENNISLNKGDRKVINEAEISSKAEDLISLVDTEGYIYYRKANKSKDCIIREYEDGTFVKFDGTRMMSDHVLESYLNVTNVNQEFRQIFHDSFCNKILKNRFEKFIPNKPHEFSEKKNSYVNLWVPGRAYKEVHELAESISEMDVETAIEVIKSTLPTSWLFLNQLTQKGSLEYFVNWLACVAQYNVMPVLPIITSVQGTGKGVFVNEWLNYYLNQEYVNVVTSEKIQSNFNAFMETSSMIVLDEGDFSKSKEVDQLKFLTGNDRITVEKKGIDSTQMKKYFNMIMLTNGECPIIHSYDDRRMSYYRLEVKLKDTVRSAGFDGINTFIDALRSEVTEFWAIILKTKIKTAWSTNNNQDNVFNKQLLMMHPFGKLVSKIIEGDWDSIEFQLNENVHDKMIMANNMEMVEEIKTNYNNFGMIGMDLINKYILSLNYKVHRNVIEYITSNQLHRFGIDVLKHEGFMKIKIDKNKLKESIYIKNNLGDLYSEFNEDNIHETLNIKKVVDTSLPTHRTVGAENVSNATVNNVSPGEGIFAIGATTIDNIPNNGYVSSIVPPLMGGSTSGIQAMPPKIDQNMM